MAKFGVKYAGLHKRDSYDGLIDYLESKQETIKFPNREAKFVRDSPQDQQLLSEGFVEVEEQQIKQIKQEQEEHAVIRTANDTNETAKEVKVVSSQTDKPLIIHTKSSGTQSNIETKASYSQSTPASVQSTGSQSKVDTRSASSQSTQMFDLTVNDNLSKVKKDIDSVENTQQQNTIQKAENISRILQNHLQTEATPDTTINFAHKIATMTGSGLKKLGSISRAGIEQLSALSSSSSSSSQEPINTSLLLGDGKGKKDWYTMNPPKMTLGDKPNLKPISCNPNPAPKQQPRKTLEKEYDDLMEDVAKPKPKPKPKPKAKALSTPASSSQTQFTQPVNKSKFTKSYATSGTQISPSKIGIQKLREELENAKNKDKLSVSDTSAYMKLYDDWKGAKGDKAMKDDKLKGLREIYKRVLYKK